jgi:hypothetical protein
MFVPIRPEAMVIGTKYKIGTITGIYVNVWDAPDGMTYFKFFEPQRQGMNRFRFFTSSITFYQFVSDRPQDKMEQRSVNMLVRRLIGDDHFEW